MGRPHKCPYCKSQQTVSKGTRITRGLGPRRLRRCKACGRKFTPRHQRPPGPGAGSDKADGMASAGKQKPTATEVDANADVVL
jgi:transposase-like protein